MLVKHGNNWLTCSDYADAHRVSDALNVRRNGQRLFDDADFLRAAFGETYDRANKRNEVTFDVERTRDEVSDAEGEFLSDFSAREGRADAKFFCGAPGKALHVYQMDGAVLVQSPGQLVAGVTYRVGYTLRGGDIYYVETIPPGEPGGGGGSAAGVGDMRLCIPFFFPGQLRAGQFGGMATFDKPIAIRSYDVFIDSLAIGDVSGSLYDGNGAPIGVDFTLESGQRLQRVTLPNEVAVAAHTNLVAVLTAAGGAEAPGQNLQLNIIARI